MKSPDPIARNKFYETALILKVITPDVISFPFMDMLWLIPVEINKIKSVNVFFPIGGTVAHFIDTIQCQFLKIGEITESKYLYLTKIKSANEIIYHNALSTYFRQKSDIDHDDEFKGMILNFYEIQFKKENFKNKHCMEHFQQALKNRYLEYSDFSSLTEDVSNGMFVISELINTKDFEFVYDKSLELSCTNNIRKLSEIIKCFIVSLCNEDPTVISKTLTYEIYNYNYFSNSYSSYGLDYKFDKANYFRELMYPFNYNNDYLLISSHHYLGYKKFPFNYLIELQPRRLIFGNQLESPENIFIRDYYIQPLTELISKYHELKRQLDIFLIKFNFSNVVDKILQISNKSFCLKSNSNKKNVYITVKKRINNFQSGNVFFDDFILRFCNYNFNITDDQIENLCRVNSNYEKGPLNLSENIKYFYQKLKSLQLNDKESEFKMLFDCVRSYIKSIYGYLPLQDDVTFRNYSWNKKEWCSIEERDNHYRWQLSKLYEQEKYDEADALTWRHLNMKEYYTCTEDLGRNAPNHYVEKYSNYFHKSKYHENFIRSDIENIELVDFAGRKEFGAQRAIDLLFNANTDVEIDTSGTSTQFVMLGNNHKKNAKPILNYDKILFGQSSENHNWDNYSIYIYSYIISNEYNINEILFSGAFEYDHIRSIYYTLCQDEQLYGPGILTFDDIFSLIGINFNSEEIELNLSKIEDKIEWMIFIKSVKKFYTNYVIVNESVENIEKYILNSRDISHTKHQLGFKAINNEIIPVYYKIAIPEFMYNSYYRVKYPLEEWFSKVFTTNFSGSSPSYIELNIQ